MSAIVDNQPIADSEEEDIFGPPEDLPVLSSSESWYESSDSASHSDDEDIAKNASEEDEAQTEDDDSKSDSELTKGKHTSTTSRLQNDKRTYLSRSSIQVYKTLLKDMHIDPDSKTWNKQQNVTLATVGLVQWTGKENDAFFTALARKGKGNVGEIARLVNSKSRLEVADYIKFLEERLQRHQLLEPSLLDVEVPAAVEINDDLEEVLDQLAESVGLEEQKKDLLEAEREYGSSDFWVLDRTKADKVEEVLTSGDEDALPQAVSPSAGLLDLKNWIRLSEKVFMNPGKSRPEDNWKNIAPKGETPSLTADALGKFYDITVDLVIRLMEEAHNTALDRLDKERRRRLPFVRKKDVQRALTTMSMKHNTFDYYVNLPRRLKLDVTNRTHKGKTKTYVPYDKVERMLAKKSRKRARASSGSSDDSSSEQDTENDEKDDDKGDDDGGEDDLDEFGPSEDEDEVNSQNTDEVEDISSGDEKHKPNDAGSPKDKPYDSTYEEISDSEYQQLELEQRLDDYNAYLDRQASHKEEARLRELLNCTFEHPGKKNKEKQKEPPNITDEMRKEIIQNNAVVDWRKDLVYQDEWETYGMKTRDVERNIAANHNKKRRLE
uniref:RNA polymerase I-specific transcription initiation factor rrn5 n=1 Tax=Talaromyces marneffei PM1 TaxID=1077442 RepID=A0A093XCK4_TALMA